LGAIANLYITASPTGVQDYLAVNSSTGQIFLQTISERISLDDLVNVDNATNAASNSALSFDTATGNTTLKSFESILDEQLAAGYSGIAFALENQGTAYAPGSSSIAVGASANATGISSIAIGRNANTNDDAAVALGTGSNVGLNGVALGYNADAGSGSIAMGKDSSSPLANGVSIGIRAKQTNNGGVVIGDNSNTGGVRSVVIGAESRASGFSGGAVVIGTDIDVPGLDVVSIGKSSNASSNNSVAIGTLSGFDGMGNNSVAVGYFTSAQGNTAVGIGIQGFSQGDRSVGIGYFYTSNGTHSIAIGSNAEATATSSVSLGHLAQSTGDRSVALGHGTAVSSANTIKLGANSSYRIDVNSQFVSNVIPAANLTYSFGNTTNRWDNIYVGNTIATDVDTVTLDVEGAGVFQSNVTFQESITVDTNTLVANSGSGRVGIGLTDPDAKLEVNGSVLVSGDVTTGYSSDERLKENIQTITDSHSILEQVRGVNFTWSEDVKHGLGMYLAPHEGEDVGVIAQEVQQVLPQAVREVPAEERWLLVEYHKLIPVLIEAVKDLNNRVKELEGQSGNGN